MAKKMRKMRIEKIEATRKKRRLWIDKMVVGSWQRRERLLWIEKMEVAKMT